MSILNNITKANPKIEGAPRVYSLFYRLNISIVLLFFPMCALVLLFALLFKQQLTTNIDAAHLENNNNISSLYLENNLIAYEKKFHLVFSQVETFIVENAIDPTTSSKNRKTKAKKEVHFDEANPILMNFITQGDPSFRNIYYANKKGDVRIYPGINLPKNFDARTRPWYQTALNHPGESVWSEIYIDKFSNAGQMITLSRALYHPKNGELLGVMGVDIDLRDITDKLIRIPLPSQGRSMLVDESGTIIAHTDPNQTGSKIPMDKIQMNLHGHYGSFKNTSNGDNVFYYKFSSPKWIAVTVVPANYTDQKTSQVMHLVLPFVVVLVAMLYGTTAMIGNIYFKNVFTEIIELIRSVSKNKLDSSMVTIKEFASIFSELGEVSKEINDTKTLVNTDKLTGLLNRHALEKDLKKLIDQGEAFSLAILDIDNFKKVNDTYGHPVGDTVLKRVSALAMALFKEQASVYRYGGEELIVVSTNIYAEQVLSMLNFWRIQTSKLEWREKDMRITFSGGFSSWNQAESYADLIKRADEALYEAKHSGKDKIISV